MDERCKAIWEKLSAALKPQVSADTFKRWFSAVELTEATEDELIRFVADRVARYKKIRLVEFIEQIPKSLSGKILRRVLVEKERAKASEAARS